MDRYYRALYEQLLRVHLSKPAKLDEFFALVFKSVKSDSNSVRVLAFVRRIIQMAMLNEASYTAASLLIVSELIREKTDLRFQLYSFDTITKSKKTRNDSDSEEEHFVDVDKEDQKKTELPKDTKKYNDLYDPLKREPKWANAESSALFELIQLTYHTHPTVSLWATKLLEGEVINYNGDPLLDFGLANFLDRIAYKNPKSVEKLAKFSSGRRMAATEQPINLYDFSGTGGENDMPQNLREEEQYLYKYFKMRGPKAITNKKKGEEGSDNDEDADLSNKLDGSDLEGEDPEMEAFANEVIEKEMKKMTKQQDDLDDEVLSGLSDDEDIEDDMEEDEQEIDEEDDDDYFDGEEGLQEVKVADDLDDDSELEIDDEEQEDEVQEYVSDEDDEEDHDDIFDKKGSAKSNGKKKKE